MEEEEEEVDTEEVEDVAVVAMEEVDMGVEDMEEVDMGVDMAVEDMEEVDTDLVDTEAADKVDGAEMEDERRGVIISVNCISFVI